MQLGDMERASSDTLDPVRLIAFRELGDFESADRVLAELSFSSGTVQRNLRHAADYLGATGRAEEMIAIVEENFSGVAELVELYTQDNGWGTEFLGPLAYIYKQAGRGREFDLLTAEMNRVLSFQEQSGIDNWYHWYCQVQRAILINDRVAATEYLQRTVDSGFASVSFVEPLFDLMADDEAFQAVVSQMTERANAERDKLGWPGYQPIAITN